MLKNSGLGRGLSSLIPKKVPDNILSESNKEFLLAESGNRVLQLPVDMIEANPMQPRQVFGHEELEELIESIKVYGIIQPIIVTKMPGGYQLIAGERRLRSAKIIGLNTVPALVREAGEQEKLELALIENIQRKNLNPMERAVAYQRLIDEFSLTQEAVADKLGVSRSTVANTVRFMQLPEKVQTALAEEKISEGHAKVIAGLPNDKEQMKFFNKVISGDLNVREAENESRQLTGKPRRTTAERVDPVTAEKAERLRDYLKTKVNIVNQNGRGQVVIEFYSEEELDSIVSSIVEK